MTRSDLSSRLRATFIAELEEQLRVLNGDALALEADPGNPELLRSVFRIAHQLKGAAAAAGVTAIAESAHELESMLANVRDQGRIPGQPEFRLLFAAADQMAAVRDTMRAGGDAPVQTTKAGPESPLAADEDDAAGVQPIHHGASGHVRVESVKLDRLLAAVEQLMISLQELSLHATELRVITGVGSHLSPESNGKGAHGSSPAAASTAGLGVLAGAVVANARALNRFGAAVVASTHSLRMRPFADACEALPRVVRDTAMQAGKEVRLEVEGAEIQADRAVLDGLRDAILHLVRNAVDHGVEAPDVRTAAGKPPHGTVTVRAELQGDQLSVTVRDDGAGLDVAGLRAALARLGRPVPADDADVVNAIFQGGVSSRSEATTISGRGVGLDLARAAVNRVRGTLDVSWEPDRGTLFTLRSPLTLITIRALLVRLGSQTFALPTNYVERVLRVSSSSVKRLEGADVLTGIPETEGPVSIASLAHLLGPPLADRPLEPNNPAVLLHVQGRRLAVLVDELLAESDVIVRRLELGSQSLPNFSGAAIVGGGRIALVVNTQALVAAALTDPAAPLARAENAVPKPRARVLVVDDSITTRTMEQALLETAGYRVLTAADGLAAWESLQAEEFDLVVADVEMPGLDGFALCRAIRSSPVLQKLPVILVTALESEEHRARGLEAGADAYIGKSSFDQQALLESVEQFLG